MWADVVSIPSADLCQTTATGILEAACAGKNRGLWLIPALSLTCCGTLSAALLSPQTYIIIIRRQDLWITVPLLLFYAEVNIRGYSHATLK